MVAIARYRRTTFDSKESAEHEQDEAYYSGDEKVSVAALRAMIAPLTIAFVEDSR